MKKISLILFLFVLLAIVSNKTQAQSYFTYDGKDFSVLLTANSGNTQIVKVQFSANGAWNTFDILDYDNLENVEGGGFAYTVKDGAGKKFLVDYYRTQDHIKVTNLETYEEWTLYRRAN
jgi:hypothetical protein